MNYRQQILEALQAKFKGGNAGVLGWIATQLAKTVTAPEQVQTAVDGISAEYVSMMEGYGDNRATSSAQTAVKNYESQYGLKDGKPNAQQVDPKQVVENPKQQPEQGGNGKGGEDMPEWAKQILEGQKTINDRLNGIETEKTTANRKTQISAILNKLPEDLRKGYERIPLDSLKEEEFNNLVTEITTEVEGISASIKQKGAVFTQPTPQQGSGTKASDAEVDAVVDKLNI